MLIDKFPDIKWLRKQAESDFGDRLDAKGNLHPQTGWPSVVLQTETRHAERNNIRGPFSIFVNLQGASLIKSEGREFTVSQNTYCITNQGQYYDLIVPEKSGAETFNIHFGQALFEEVVYSLSHSEEFLLDSPMVTESSDFALFPHTGWKDIAFCNWIADIQGFYADHTLLSQPNERETELLSEFLAYVLHQDQSFIQKSKQLKSSKSSTRTELLRRVFLAIDYIHDTFPAPISLETLSREVGVSKFHLQRTFKQITGRTPQQYLSHLRLQKATQFLQDDVHSLTHIAEQLGFSELPSFSRFFYKHYHQSPTQFKNEISNFG